MKNDLTEACLDDALLGWVLLATCSGASAKFRHVQKFLHYCPATGEFKISATSGGDIVTKARADAVKFFNGLDLGKL